MNLGGFAAAGILREEKRGLRACTGGHRNVLEHVHHPLFVQTVPVRSVIRSQREDDEVEASRGVQLPLRTHTALWINPLLAIPGPPAWAGRGAVPLHRTDPSSHTLLLAPASCLYLLLQRAHHLPSVRFTFFPSLFPISVFSSPKFTLRPVLQPCSDSSPILGLSPQPRPAQNSLVLLPRLTQTQKTAKPRGPTTDRPSPGLHNPATAWCCYTTFSTQIASLQPTKAAMSDGCPQPSLQEGKKQQVAANLAQVP